MDEITYPFSQTMTVSSLPSLGSHMNNFFRLPIITFSIIIVPLSLLPTTILSQ